MTSNYRSYRQIIAYTTSIINLDEDTRVYFLILSYTNGTIIKNETLSYSGPHDLSWTPDSNLISFVVELDDYTSTVVMYNINQSTFTEVHTFPLQIDSIRWASVGPYYIFSTQVYPSTTMEETAAIDQEKENDPAELMVFDQMFVYHWDTYETGKYRHVMYMKLGEEDTDTKYVFNGTVKDVMVDFDGNCPSKPDGLSLLFSFPLLLFSSFPMYFSLSLTTHSWH